MPKGSASSETRIRPAPAARNTRARTTITATVVAVTSNGLSGASPQSGQEVRKSGGHTFGGKVGSQR